MLVLPAVTKVRVALPIPALGDVMRIQSGFGVDTVQAQAVEKKKLPPPPEAGNVSELLDRVTAQPEPDWNKLTLLLPMLIEPVRSC